MHIGTHRESRIGVPEPLRYDDNGKALHMHQRASIDVTREDPQRRDRGRSLGDQQTSGATA
jgi:hypothetical protein